MAALFVCFNLNFFQHRITPLLLLLLLLFLLLWLLLLLLLSLWLSLLLWLVARQCPGCLGNVHEGVSQHCQPHRLRVIKQPLLQDPECVCVAQCVAQK